jgi:hypothetical protein
VFTGHDLIINEERVAPRLSFESGEECDCDIRNFRMPARDPTAVYLLSNVAGLRYDESLILGRPWTTYLELASLIKCW